MGFVDALRHYFASSGDDAAARSRDLIRYAAIGITAGYTVSLTYRAGGFKPVMPERAYTRLVAGVEWLKEGTQPLVNKERFSLCGQHLIQTYSIFAGGCILSALGTRAFFALPDFPIGVPIAISATAATTIMFARQWMTPPGKLLAYGAMCFATGMAFGPLNWVAYDTVLPFAMIVGSTAVGFCAPLYITRGVVSYFCSAQLLSCSLSIVGAGLVVANAKANGTPAATRRLEHDVSSMITFQIITNIAVGALHTIPTIYRFMKNTPMELETEDPVTQASMIYGAFAYSLWSFFRITCARILRMGKGNKKNRDDVESVVGTVGSRAAGDGVFSIRNMSNVGASLLFLFTYVRCVTYLQNRNNGSSRSLDLLRKIFAKFSPLSLA